MQWYGNNYPVDLPAKVHDTNDFTAKTLVEDTDGMDQKDKVREKKKIAMSEKNVTQRIRIVDDDNSMACKKCR